MDYFAKEIGLFFMRLFANIGITSFIDEEFATPVGYFILIISAIIIVWLFFRKPTSGN